MRAPRPKQTVLVGLRKSLRKSDPLELGLQLDRDPLHFQHQVRGVLLLLRRVVNKVRERPHVVHVRQAQHERAQGCVCLLTEYHACRGLVAARRRRLNVVGALLLQLFPSLAQALDAQPGHQHL